MNEQDVHKLVLSVLQLAKNILQRDKYLAPLAFVLTSDNETLICGLDFATEEEKMNSYQRLARLARANRALAVVTLNDARFDAAENKEDRNTYYPGKFRDKCSAECICVAVKAPKSKSWGVIAEYTRESTQIGEEIVFGQEQVLQELDVRMIPSWKIEQ